MKYYLEIREDFAPQDLATRLPAILRVEAQHEAAARNTMRLLARPGQPFFRVPFTARFHNHTPGSPCSSRRLARGHADGSISEDP